MKTDFRKVLIDELDLSVRAFNVLQYNGIKTLADLDARWAELPRMRRCGRKTLHEIRSSAAECGLVLPARAAASRRAQSLTVGEAKKCVASLKAIDAALPKKSALAPVADVLVLLRSHLRVAICDHEMVLGHAKREVELSAQAEEWLVVLEPPAPTFVHDQIVRRESQARGVLAQALFNSGLAWKQIAAFFERSYGSIGWRRLRHWSYGDEAKRWLAAVRVRKEHLSRFRKVADAKLAKLPKKAKKPPGSPRMRAVDFIEHAPPQRMHERCDVRFSDAQWGVTIRLTITRAAAEGPWHIYCPQMGIDRSLGVMDRRSAEQAAIKLGREQIAAYRAQGGDGDFQRAKDLTS